MGWTKFTQAHHEQVRELFKSGLSTRQIASKLSMSKTTAACLAKLVPEGDFVKKLCIGPSNRWHEDVQWTGRLTHAQIWLCSYVF